MIVYVATEGLNNEPTKVYFSPEQARQEICAGDRVYPVEIANLDGWIDKYFKFRGYQEPNPQEAYLFLVAEVGKLADELVTRLSPNWVRNNPQNKGNGVEGEIGDVLMMLTKLASTLDLDPIRCLEQKMASKGFTNHT